MTWRARFAELWPAPLAGVAALALYARTLAPGLTWAHDGADGGDLLAAALMHGVPHPPGYPAYQLLLQAVLALPPAGRHPARAGNWLSAVCAALAVALLADLIRRSLSGSPARRAVAVVAALAWAASPALWGQATITEVYTLNALFALAILWCAWRWSEALPRSPGPAASPSAETLLGALRPPALSQAAAPLRAPNPAAWRWLALAALLFGLGLGNHLTLALLLPGLAAWLFAHRGGLCATPRRAWFAIALAFTAGLSCYLYLPLAASRGPAVNWADPSTPERFFWLITARPYSGLVAGLAPQWLPGRLAAWAREALRQFWPWGALLALLGLWQLDRRAHAWWRATLLVALAFTLYALTYNTAGSYVYLIPAWAMSALWLAWGLDYLTNRVARYVSAHPEMTHLPFLRSSTTRREAGKGLVGPRAASSHPPVSLSPHLPILLLALVALPVALVVGGYGGQDLSHDRAAEDFVVSSLAAARPGATILTATDRPTFALSYAISGLGRSDGLGRDAGLRAVNVYLCAYPWYRQALAARDQRLAALWPGDQWPGWPAILGALAQLGPLYRAEPLPIDTPGFRSQPAGPLTELVPE